MKFNIKQHLSALLLVPAIALTVSGLVAPAAFAADPTCGDIKSGIKDSAACAKGSNTPTSLFGDGTDGGIFQTVANVLLFIVGAVSVIMLIVGGIRYTISQGDSGAVTSAKNTILYAIIGIVVSLLAFAVVNFVITSFATDATAQ